MWRHSAYLSMGEKRARMERRAARRRFLRYRLPAYLLLLAAACWAAWQHYRRLYPLEQVCPAEGDRFYDHCQEGRFHYLVELDFECLGKDRARMMLQAIGRPDRLAIGDMWPVGRVPAWLTLADAKAIRDGPCLERLRLDTACYYCEPTPKVSGGGSGRDAQGRDEQQQGLAAVSSKAGMS